MLKENFVTLWLCYSVTFWCELVLLDLLRPFNGFWLKVTKRVWYVAFTTHPKDDPDFNFKGNSQKIQSNLQQRVLGNQHCVPLYSDVMGLTSFVLLTSHIRIARHISFYLGSTWTYCIFNFVHSHRGCMQSRSLLTPWPPSCRCDQLPVVFVAPLIAEVPISLNASLWAQRRPLLEISGDRGTKPASERILRG